MSNTYGTTKVSGKDGNVTKDGVTVLGITNWKTTAKSTNPEYVDNEGAGWTNREAGAKDWSGSFELSRPPAFGEGTKLAFCGYTGGDTWSGNIIVDSVDVNVDLATKAIVGYTVAFSGNGALTKTSGSA